MKPLNPETLSTPQGYNNGMLSASGRVVFVSGQIGWDKDRRMAEGLVAQFDRAIRNILDVVRDGGGRPEQIGSFTIYIKDKKDYIRLRKEIGVVYRNHMGKHYPAMSLLIVNDLLEDKALVEIEATAVIR